MLAAAATALAACGTPARTTTALPAPKAPGYLGQLCAGVPLYVSSGNGRGKCHAQVDDASGQLAAMACDDGAGNAARLTCSAAGEITCKSAGTGVCTTDESIVLPAAPPPADAIANRCAGVAYFVIGQRCRAAKDAMSGAISVHCDDGAGDSADYACRDAVVACSAQGTGVCHP